MSSRRDLLTALAMVGVAGCVGSPSADDRTTGTPRSTGEPSRTGAPAGSPAASPDRTSTAPSGAAVRWTRELGGSVGHRPTVHEGTLYVAGGTNANEPPGDREYLRPGAGENVYALSLGGDERWRYVARAGFESRPRVVAGGVHAVVGWNAGTHGVDQRLVRLADGERQWEARIEEGYLSILGDRDGTTFVGTSDDAYGLSGETTHAVARDGHERWRVESGDAREGLVDGETLYVPYGARRTTAIDVETGRERWVRGMPPAGGDLRAFGDTLYLRSEEENADGDYPLVAVDATTGEERWRYASAGGDEGPFVPTGAVEGGGERVYGTEYGGLLFALDAATGEERWRYPVEAETRDPPAFADGTVYLPARDGEVHAVTPDGDRRWVCSVGAHLTELHANEAGVVVATRGTRGRADGLTALGHDGTEWWSFAHPGDLTRAAVDGAEVYVGTGGGFVVALG